MSTKKSRFIHKLEITPNNYTKKKKREISTELKPITDEEALIEFSKVRTYNLEHIGLSRIGNKTVDKYTYSERLNTRGNKGLSFYDFFYNRDKFKSKRYINNILGYCAKHEKKSPKTDVKIWIAIFNMYFGSVNIFRPLISAKIYEIFKPESVLDFTMGWGGRMVGAMALNIPNYIGIDNNMNLKIPYRDMVKLLKPHTSTRVKLLFKNALDVDYFKLKYDMVLTSPPYYDIEVYGDAPDDTENAYKTRDDWNELFYRPLFSRTYSALKSGGYYCLNIPDTLYSSVCIPLFGVADTTIFFDKKPRLNNYKEFIYVWKKRD
jgi:hypothetical protein